jgi:hypothetical protein
MIEKTDQNAAWRLLLASGLLLTTLATASADTMTSVMLNVPDHSEEALTWCGPATAQMVMEGYPSGSCTKLQEDIWGSIQTNKTEAMWDTDPAGMKGAMQQLCPPPGGHYWLVFGNLNAQSLMYSVAYWMNRNKYPVAGLLSTVPHNGLSGHGEHWVAIRGIITDKDPTVLGNTSVELKFVWFNDPSPENLGDSSIERFVSGSVWYGEFQPVNKAGSIYNGKYVAVIEPPKIRGVAIAPKEVLTGRIISPETAVKRAAEWIAKYKLADMKPYASLKRTKALKPLLVNGARGGYYIIPFAEEGSRLAGTAILVNAYTGNFQEVGAFKPVPYLSKEEAVGNTLRQLNLDKSNTADAELVNAQGGNVGNRYFPSWNVTVGNRVVNIDLRGTMLLDR